MKAGALRHRVTLRSPGGSRDALGERTTTWTDVATVWAAVEPLTVREMFLAAQAHSSTTHKVTIRYSSDVAGVAASWSVLFGTRVLVIDGVRNVDERNRELILMCTEGLKSE